MLEINFKERKRYLVFRVLTEANEMEIPEKKLIKAISNQLIRLFGEVGASRTHFWIHNYDEHNKIGLIECRLKYLTLIRATIASITKIEETPVLIYSRGVTGTIKSAKRKYLNLLAK